MTDRLPIYINLDLHRTIKIAAAEQSTSMKALTERLIRLGMIAPDLARRLRDLTFGCDWESLDKAGAALAAFEAALNENGKETA